MKDASDGASAFNPSGAGRHRGRSWARAALRRVNTGYGQSAWFLPGGKIDYGQTAAEAVAREVREETELVVVGAEFLLLQDSLPLEAEGMHCINFYSRCRVCGELRLNDEPSVLAWGTASDYGDYNIAFRNDEALCAHFQEYTQPQYPPLRNEG